MSIKNINTGWVAFKFKTSETKTLPNLWSRYMTLVRPDDCEVYQKSKFQHHRADKFLLVIVTKNKYPPDDWIEMLYPLRIVLPGN